MHFRLSWPWAIGAILALSSIGCSSDEGSSPGAAGSSAQAGSAGQTSAGGAGSSAGSGGAGRTDRIVMADASIDVAAPASDADLGMHEASSSDQISTDATGPFALTSA